MNKLDCIRSFILVSRYTNFSRAAEVRGITRSTISKQIQYLESDLRTSLFERTTQSVRLTQAGETYLDTCKKLLTDLDDTERFISETGKIIAGDIRVLSPRALGASLVYSAAREFCERYPKVTINLVIQNHAKMIATRDFDLAFLVGELEAPVGLTRRHLFRSQWICCASPIYLEKRGKPAKPSDLGLHNCLLHSTVSPKAIWEFQREGQTLSQSVAGSMRSNSTTILRDAALEGAGITLLPDYIALDDIERGKLVQLFDFYTILELPVFMLFESVKHQPGRLRSFIDFFVKYVTDRRTSRDRGGTEP